MKDNRLKSQGELMHKIGLALIHIEEFYLQHGEDITGFSFLLTSKNGVEFGECVGDIVHCERGLETIRQVVLQAIEEAKSQGEREFLEQLNFSNQKPN